MLGSKKANQKDKSNISGVLWKRTKAPLLVHVCSCHVVCGIAQAGCRDCPAVNESHQWALDSFLISQIATLTFSGISALRKGQFFLIFIQVLSAHYEKVLKVS